MLARGGCCGRFVKDASGDGGLSGRWCERGSYKNKLLNLAEDLGRRFLPAFDSPTGLQYAWIKLKYGVMENETTETSTSGCGSLILEMGVLSRLTGDLRYESAALRALRKLWSRQVP
ncbi:hypothetical protein CRYUN_Cryun12cG0140300 [Craigia yunnanensis]